MPLALSCSVAARFHVGKATLRGYSESNFAMLFPAESRSEDTGERDLGAFSRRTSSLKIVSLCQHSPCIHFGSELDAFL